MIALIDGEIPMPGLVGGVSWDPPEPPILNDRDVVTLTCIHCRAGVMEDHLPGCPMHTGLSR